MGAAMQPKQMEQDLEFARKVLERCTPHVGIRSIYLFWAVVGVLGAIGLLFSALAEESKELQGDA